MSTHFIDKERAFVDGLLPDTGRSLADWMTAIETSGCGSRNDIIDWLRQHGFTFAKASWLERIHHNGGELIYAGAVPRRVEQGVKSSPKRSGPPDSLPSQLSEPIGAIQPAAAPHVFRLKQSPSVNTEADLDALLASAKAYRPLAQALLREILSTVPGADPEVVEAVVTFELVHVFAALAPGPKGVRLHLPDLGVVPTGWQRAKPGVPAVPPALARLSLSLMLTDARQIEPSLLRQIANAARTPPP